MVKAEDICIVIPVHNKRQLTLKCLESLERQTIKGARIIVVDDGSTDGTAKAIRTKFPCVTILRGNGNLWWSASMNLGVKCALELDTAYIISLNNDLEVAEDYIEKMIYWAQQKPSAILGSYAFDIKTGLPVYGGERIIWQKMKYVSLLDVLPPENRTGIHEVTHFPGRGLWIPAEVFKSIGLFDAKWLPHYSADYDFTFRARENGFELYCNFDAKLYSHVECSGNYENRASYSLRNYFRNLFSIKGGGNIKNITVICFRHCPKKFLVQFWLYSLSARFGGYLRDWVKHDILRGI
jgi:GT2 family glycosyltransferase